MLRAFWTLSTQAIEIIKISSLNISILLTPATLYGHPRVYWDHVFILTLLSIVNHGWTAMLVKCFILRVSWHSSQFSCFLKSLSERHLNASGLWLNCLSKGSMITHELLGRMNCITSNWSSTPKRYFFLIFRSKKIRGQISSYWTGSVRRWTLLFSHSIFLQYHYTFVSHYTYRTQALRSTVLYKRHHYVTSCWL